MIELVGVLVSFAVVGILGMTALLLISIVTLGALAGMAATTPREQLVNRL